MKDLGYEIGYKKSKIIKKLYLELTDRCNLNCAFCYRKSWDKCFQDMSQKVYEKLMKDIKEIEGIERIVLGGIGEPTCFVGFERVLEDLKDYKLHITTNGTLLTDALIEKIVDTVSYITISVDGVEDYFEAIRGISLDRVVDGINRLQAAKKRRRSSTPELQLQFVSSKTNIDSLFQVIDLAKELDCYQLIISSLIPQIDENKDKILYTKEGSNKLMKDLWNRARNYAFRKGITIYLPNIQLKTERGCSFIDDVTTYISAEGDAIPCYRLSHDYDEYVFGRRKRVTKHSFGNIMDSSILEIWNSKEYQQYR
ncbi:MAG: radical SAM protein, partial [Flavobacteriales bacterium]|nr:radical SAM protein [Flavobacteriales bacterium]